jgi:hypothetical protein
MNNVVKFPFNASRRAHARKPRRSKNGAPEERTAKAPRIGEPAALMPIDMPLGGTTVYLRIAEHRQAVVVYDRCVDAENEAEGKVSDGDFAVLQQARSQAFEEMMFAARCLIIDVPTTITGLIRWTRYVRQLLIDWDGCNSGSPYLPDEINGKPWIDPFLRILTRRLRNMGKKLPDEKAAVMKRPRRTNAEAFARKGEFNAAMRQRIRDIAASRGLSNEEIKPAMTLKHVEIGRFVQQHGVSWQWLLEGCGRMFKKDVLTSREFAVIVAQQPIPEQKAIWAEVREMIEGLP